MCFWRVYKVERFISQHRWFPALSFQFSAHDNNNGFRWVYTHSFYTLIQIVICFLFYDDFRSLKSFLCYFVPFLGGKRAVSEKGKSNVRNDNSRPSDAIYFKRFPFEKYAIAMGWLILGAQIKMMKIGVAIILLELRKICSTIFLWIFSFFSITQSGRPPIYYITISL